VKKEVRLSARALAELEVGRGEEDLCRAGKKPRFFWIFFRFLCFLGFLRFFLGF